MDDRVFIILNPISGGGSGRRVLPRFVDALRRRGMEAEVFETTRPGDARDTAEARGDEFRWVVAMGGDGTINEVLNGLPNPSRTALGTIPVGTSNILARELQLPRHPEKAAAVIAGRRSVPIDMAVANDRRFLMCAGVGWDAEVLQRLEAVRRGPISHAHYLQPIAMATMKYDFPEIRIRIDGETNAGSMVFLSNIKNYAAFFTVTPEAVFDDGLIDVCIIHGNRRRDFLRWFAAAYTGRLTDYNDVTVTRGSRIEIDADRPLPYQVDGDSAGQTPLTVQVHPHGARFLVNGRASAGPGRP
jgi:diacylglycerol kinase (ATP)